MVWMMALALAGGPDVGSLQHVQGSLVTLRDAPDGAAVGMLRIGSEVEVTDRRGAWAQVSLLGRPADHAVVGFVRADLLRDVPVGRDEAARRAADTLDPLEAARWQERWEALDPHHAGVVADEPVYVGMCEAGRARVVARLHEGALEPLSGRDRPTLQPLADELGAWAWYRAGEARPIAGTPFPLPFVAPTDNELGGSAYDAGEDAFLGAASGSWQLVLGPCAGTGLVATQPLEPVEDAAADGRADVVESWSRSRHHVLGGAVRHPVAGLPLREVRLAVRYQPATCGGLLDAVEGTAYAVLAPGETPDELVLVDPEPLGWFRLGERVLGAYGSHQPADDLLELHLVDGERHVRQQVHLAYRGC